MARAGNPLVMPPRFVHLLDGLACGVAGHVWLQQIETESDGVMVCVRCGARDETGVDAARAEAQAREAHGGDTDEGQQSDGPDLVPESRPWLEPPFHSFE
jgi:hypothetical protein